MHRIRLNEIEKSSTDRIDNKLSEFHLTAPCKNKADKPNLELLNENKKYLNAIVQISKRNNSKELKSQIEKLNNYASISQSIKKNNDRVLDFENSKFYHRIASVKSQFSLKS